LTLHDFYPGNEYVDWIGVSVFQQVYHRNKPKQSTSSLATSSLPSFSSSPADIWSGGSYYGTLVPVLQFAEAHDKPVMIAESTPFGWRASYTNENQVMERWFEPVLSMIHEYSHIIGMWSYIDCNWESQPMWHNVGFGDTRVFSGTTPTFIKYWQTNVLNRTLGYGSLSKYCSHDKNKTTTSTPNPTDITVATQDTAAASVPWITTNSEMADLWTNDTFPSFSPFIARFSNTVIIVMIFLVAAALVVRRQHRQQQQQQKHHQRILYERIPE
jgi:hypothetical protein